MPVNSNDASDEKKARELLAEAKERVRKLKNSDVISDDILKLIEDAESALNKNEPAAALDKSNDALNKIDKLEASLRAEPLATRLLWIEIGFLAVLLALAYALYKCPDFTLWQGLKVNPAFRHLQTAWFGALGGITIAIYGIYSHVQARDFDPRMKLWYLCKPLIGGIFGWFVYLIYYIGLVSVQGAAPEVKNPELPFVIAFLAGFSERFTLKMIDKLMGVLTTWEEKSAKTGAKKETVK